MCFQFLIAANNTFKIWNNEFQKIQYGPNPFNPFASILYMK